MQNKMYCLFKLNLKFSYKHDYISNTFYRNEFYTNMLAIPRDIIEMLPKSD